MKKVVKLDLTKSNFYCYENFEDITHILKPFFTAGGSHCIPVKIAIREVRDRVYVYTQVECPCDGCAEKREQVIELSYGGYIPEVFFDHRYIRTCVKIAVAGRYAGGYCPAFNVLALSDWSHDEACVEVAKEVLPMLIKELKLKKIKNKKENRRGVKVDIMLGADPEFEELDARAEGYAPIRTSYRGTDPKQEIGADGSGDQIELRPKPGRRPIEIVSNIRKLIKRIKVPISVKGDRYPLGAHIHLGIPEFFKSREAIKAMVTVLDDFLGRKLINLSGRARGGYKILGAYETKPWGFEYRSLPSAYLLSPVVTRIVFKIVKNVVKRLLEKGRVVYNETPKKRDYIRLAKLTEKEWKIFNRFIKQYPEYSGVAINQNWGAKVRKVREKFVLNVCFNDDWSNRVKVIFDRELQKRVRWFKKYGVNTITLYGLKQSRGKVVAGFDCSGYERIEHPICRNYGSRYYFGLPYDLRMSGTEEEIKKVVLCILKTIKKISLENSTTVAEATE